MIELKTLRNLNMGLFDDDSRCICGRTLKEHDWNFDNRKQPCEDTGCEDFISIKQKIKQEGVKWMKWIQTNDCIIAGKFQDEQLTDKEKVKVKAGMFYFAKIFFDVKDEDLK